MSTPIFRKLWTLPADDWCCLLCSISSMISACIDFLVSYTAEEYCFNWTNHSSYPVCFLLFAFWQLIERITSPKNHKKLSVGRYMKYRKEERDRALKESTNLLNCIEDEERNPKRQRMKLERLQFKVMFLKLKFYFVMASGRYLTCSRMYLLCTF